MTTLREQLDQYIKQKYNVEPEQLPFKHEDYAIYRHTDTGKWFAVFIVKPRQEFGLEGEGDAEIVSFKPRDAMYADFMSQQPGYLCGYPSRGWNWLSALLDGSIAFENICRWLEESYEATVSKAKNKKTPLQKRKTKKEMKYNYEC